MLNRNEVLEIAEIAKATQHRADIVNARLPGTRHLRRIDAYEVMKKKLGREPTDTDVFLFKLFRETYEEGHTSGKIGE
jgi:hypothetical protein